MTIRSLGQSQEIEGNLCKYLVDHDSPYPEVQFFVDAFIRHALDQRKNGKIEITKIGFEPSHLWYALLGAKRPTSKLVDDPIPLVNQLFRHVIATGQTGFVLDSRIVLGFSGIGRFHDLFAWSFQKGKLLSPDIQYPPYLVVHIPGGSYWTRRPEGEKERLLHFIYCLRQCVAVLATEPIGKRSNTSAADIAHLLTSLPRRIALVRSGDVIRRIHTYDTPTALQGLQLADCLTAIQAQTRQKYCRPKAEVEQEQLGGSSPSQPQQPKPRWKVNE